MVGSACCERSSGWPLCDLPYVFLSFFILSGLITVATKTVEGTTVRLNVAEGAGNEDFDKLRPLTYPATVGL